MPNYEIGQYRYSGRGCVTPISPILSYKKAGEDSSFQDVQISPNNGTFTKGQDYYLKVEIPQDLNYDMSFNIKLIKRTDEETSFQYIKQVTIPRGGTGSSAYTVVLYEKTDGDVAAQIPHTYKASTSNKFDEVYYDAGNNKYYLGTGTTAYTPLTKYNVVSLIASWKGGEGEDVYGVFDMVFRPVDDNFAYINLQMVRNAEDYNIQNVGASGTEYGRKLDINKVKTTIYQVSNLVPQMNPSGKLDKIGVWGHSGLLMVINGEEIRIGPSGYYELDSLPVSTFGVVAPTGDYSNMFTVDYQYIVG